MTDIRGEKVDEGKVWAACPTYVNELSTCVKLTLGGPMDLIEMARLAESVRLGVDRLVDENASLRARVKVLEEAVDYQLDQFKKGGNHFAYELLRRRAGRE